MFYVFSCKTLFHQHADRYRVLDHASVIFKDDMTQIACASGGRITAETVLHNNHTALEYADLKADEHEALQLT